MRNEDTRPPSDEAENANRQADSAPVRRWTLLLSAAAAGAVIGGTIGTVAGPQGILIGAAVGALIAAFIALFAIYNPKRVVLRGAGFGSFEAEFA